MRRKFTYYHAALKVGRSKAHAPVGQDIIRFPDIRVVVGGTRTVAFQKRSVTLVASNKLTLSLYISAEEPEDFQSAFTEALDDLIRIRKLAGNLMKERQTLLKSGENE